MNNLQNLDVLVVDCQTTGPNPERGHLLEIAWCRTSAAAPADPAITSRLAALPEGGEVPPRISALTGITTDDLAAAVPAGTAWAELRAAAGGAATPAVIHFAHFELPFLRALHEAQAAEPGAAGEFPLDVICTHEIARRLLPDLPRRGLHALAGYFGHRTPELKRAAAHVRATVAVWSALVERLASEPGVRTLAELRGWLARTPVPRRGRRHYPLDRQVRLGLPTGPGVYRMLDATGAVLYVGKATSLRHRVNSYFQKQRHAADRTLELLTQVRDVQVTETGSAAEAALRETDAIKEHDPPYNVALRERSRGVQYLSSDLREASSSTDKKFRIGPVVHAESVVSLGVLRDLLASGPSDRPAPPELLARPAEYLPDQACFEQGLAEFRARHGARDLLALGRHLWAEYRAAQAAAAAAAPEEDEGDDEDLELGDGEEPEWDPERVADALEHLVRHAAHQIRRGRWLAWLAEGALAWQPRDRRRRRHLIVLHRGRLVEAGSLGRSAEVPLPPGGQRSRRERLACFDPATFDRLRVLTTELRRLVAEDRHPELRLGPRVLMTASRLGRLLEWV